MLSRTQLSRFQFTFHYFRFEPSDAPFGRWGSHVFTFHYFRFELSRYFQHILKQLYLHSTILDLNEIADALGTMLAHLHSTILDLNGIIALSEDRGETIYIPLF